MCTKLASRAGDAIVRVLPVLSVVVLLATIVYKYLSNKGMYLFQPCHVLNIMLVSDGGDALP